MLPALYCVTVNWNLWPDTIACVESLLAAGAPLERVVVVDNASQDDSIGRLSARFGKELPLVRSPHNAGYGVGANLGIKYALSQGAEWVLLLNNDTHVAGTFLAELAQAAARGREYAIFGPLILYAHQPQRVWNLGDRRLMGSLLTHSLYRGRSEPTRLPALVQVDFITGCAMLVRAGVFAKTGLFDPAIFMYGEDVDFCWRARLCGFRIAAAPRAKMWHRVSSSSNRDRPSARYWRIRNQIRFYRKYARKWHLLLLLVFTAARAFWLALGDLAAGRANAIGHTLHAWFDGWFKRPDTSAEDLEWNW